MTQPADETPRVGDAAMSADDHCRAYLDEITHLLENILTEERDATARAAEKLADQIAADRLVHIYGPGGHSNLAAQEVFFRAGGLMHMSAVLDEGTLLSSGALRSMAVERLPGYGKVVITQQGLGPEDVLLLVNAYGINAALIDAALEARSRGAFVISVSSHRHAAETAADHPARHPEGHNLHDLADIAIDCKVPIGDAVVEIPGALEKTAAVSTMANAFALNTLVIHTIAELARREVEIPMWRSGNAPGGDEANARFLARFRDRVHWL